MCVRGSRFPAKSPVSVISTHSLPAAAPPPNVCDGDAGIAITLAGISKWFDSAEGEPLTALENINRRSRAIDLRNPGPVGLRQKHAAQYHLGNLEARPGAGLFWRRSRQRFR